MYPSLEVTKASLPVQVESGVGGRDTAVTVAVRSGVVVGRGVEVDVAVDVGAGVGVGVSVIVGELVSSMAVFVTRVVGWEQAESRIAARRTYTLKDHTCLCVFIISVLPQMFIGLLDHIIRYFVICRRGSRKLQRLHHLPVHLQPGFGIFHQQNLSIKLGIL